MLLESSEEVPGEQFESEVLVSGSQPWLRAVCDQSFASPLPLLFLICKTEIVVSSHLPVH